MLSPSDKLLDAMQFIMFARIPWGRGKNQGGEERKENIQEKNSAVAYNLEYSFD